MAELRLPDVTIVCVDDIAVPYSEIALRDTLEVFQPADLLFWNNGSDFDAACHLPFTGGSIDAAGDVLWYQVPFKVETSHLLIVQWDGFALDAAAWTDEFLAYDYIGAPWQWMAADQQVGNGGFSLRSVRLMRFLAEHASELPYRFPEDDMICHHYRPALEQSGFRFAPPDLARRFSFEDRRSVASTFGFHGGWNWEIVLNDKQARDRLRLRGSNDYVENRIDWTMMRTRAGYRETYHA
jgi:hypothetical protein